MEAKLLLDTQNQLGEGAFWDWKANELIWIDIENGSLHWYQPQNKQKRSVKFDQKIGTVVPTTNANYVVALQNGIHLWETKTAKLTLLAAPEKHLPQNRFNDGKADPQGRFWAGTMAMQNPDTQKTGALYCYANDSIRQMITGVSISNGITWSADSKKMYYIDTPTRQVQEFDFEPNTGNIAFNRVAVQVPDSLGYPDGMTIDQQGNLWIALWGGYGVGCWQPQTGMLIDFVKVPAPHVTACAFGGQQANELFITTARVGLTEQQLLQYPQSGGVFVCKTTASGVKMPFYAVKDTK